MLYVIRHGQTDWNSKKITMGRKDIPLNNEGIKQANITKEILNKFDIDLIISSPLIRTRQTAEIINKDKKIDIVFDDRIQERYLGKLEGNKYPIDNDKLWDINANSIEYGIESMVDFKNRVYSFLEDITREYEDKNILLVTHGGVSALINCYFNDSLYEGNISLKFLNNCSVAKYNNTKILKKTK